ncbi:hypothetical protein [Streptomyces sp. R44]|uniref:HTH cro/C1-type domain-containing protein n=1 Tax=Streptomyces sp. R44 TaxID=3238633 RepID=A0AB39TBV8_9ACTN
MGEAFDATGGGTAREELARRIGAAWTRSGCLAQERIEARLKSRFAGRNMRGLSDSSFNRYKDPEATALPDPEVLAALAELFGVGAEEAGRWARLLDEARAEARRRRAAVRGTKALLEPPGAAGAGSNTDPTEASAGQPRPVEPTEASAEQPQPVEPTQASPRQPAPAVADRHDARDQAPTRGRNATGRRALMGAVALAAVVATWAAAHLPSSPAGGRAPGAAAGGKASEGPVAAGGAPVGPPAVTGTAAPGPMTGDYRCGKVRAVEHAAWSACSQILDDGDTLRFAVRIDNPGSRSVTVRARLSWVRSRVVTPCPAPWGTGVRLTVPAGRSAVTPLDACPRKTTRPSAYQAMAWVIAETDMDWGARETSMTVHVLPDRYRWNDQLP